ncbi:MULTISPECIES: hypothetical protein [Acidithrix]|uniref:Antitoxin n=1 Tax=Acidithrix ferrooxidans TaxID=1280514 RepID=A0A0D8HD18_9ACTN|nr:MULTISPECIES: hypothetical protein [Acidithrix]KJF15830.1 hypothetical protein AXFE_33130 [Acidithrix ferrooxidans]
MAQPLVVAPVVEVRQKLSAILARFRTEGKTAAPLFLGAHRTPEAVLLSYQQYQEIMTELDQLQSQRDRSQTDMVALASVRAEGQEPTALSHSLEAQVTAGQLSDADALTALKRHHTQGPPT